MRRIDPEAIAIARPAADSGQSRLRALRALPQREGLPVPRTGRVWPSAGRILDAGCGGGGMPLSFAEEARQVVGIDLAPRFGDAGHRLARRARRQEPAFHARRRPGAAVPGRLVRHGAVACRHRARGRRGALPARTGQRAEARRHDVPVDGAVPVVRRRAPAEARGPDPAAPAAGAPRRRSASSCGWRATRRGPCRSRSTRTRSSSSRARAGRSTTTCSRRCAFPRLARAHPAGSPDDRHRGPPGDGHVPPGAGAGRPLAPRDPAHPGHRRRQHRARPRPRPGRIAARAMATIDTYRPEDERQIAAMYRRVFGAGCRRGQPAAVGVAVPAQPQLPAGGPDHLGGAGGPDRHRPVRGDAGPRVGAGPGNRRRPGAWTSWSRPNGSGRASARCCSARGSRTSGPPSGSGCRSRRAGSSRSCAGRTWARCPAS
ncbi:MAG: hypothetical protein MZU84_03965 [Sphingobacterium sp.]|nr:hypothetical protein [Sphingobacterium sp.]